MSGANVADDAPPRTRPAAPPRYACAAHHIRRASILTSTSSAPNSIDTAATMLVKLANDAGGNDNITAMLVRIDRSPAWGRGSSAGAFVRGGVAEGRGPNALGSGGVGTPAPGQFVRMLGGRDPSLGEFVRMLGGSRPLARRIRSHARGSRPRPTRTRSGGGSAEGRQVHVYFDYTADGSAVIDAQALRRMLAE